MSLRKITFTGLKTAHLACLALWFGGVATWLPLIATVDTTAYTSLYQTHLHMRDIAWNVIGWGGIGSFFTGLLLSFVSRWYLFRYRWVTIKFIVVAALIAFGMFFIEDMMLSNLAILEEKQELALNDPTLQRNLRMIGISISAEIVIFLGLILLSLTKPWSRSRANKPANKPIS